MHLLDETAASSELRHQAHRNPEHGRIARQPNAGRPGGSKGKDRPGIRRLRVVPAPGGFAFVED